jgi:hypothetical protein
MEEKIKNFPYTQQNNDKRDKNKRQIDNIQEWQILGDKV